MRRFRLRFFTIWLSYDVLDLLLGGTALFRWVGVGSPGLIVPLAGLQCGLIAAESGLLLGWAGGPLAFLACLLRAAQAYWFLRLNDFFCFCVTALILAQFGSRAPQPRWPREVLRWQTAWIYFATASLKTSRVWLSGGHLFVRHSYLLAGGRWPYPPLYRSFVSTLTGNAVLAWAGLLAEFSLAALLLLNGPARVTRLLAIAVHAYAAAALNVWFFGASMIAQVCFVTEA